MAQTDFPARWKEAEELHRLPDLLAATHLSGAVLGLDQEGKLRPVVSERLGVPTRNASCPDFAARFLWIVRSSEHPANGGKAIERLLRPGGPEISLPGPPLGDKAGRLEAEQTARRVVTAFLSGDPAGIKLVASRRSSQLAECTRPGPLIKGTKAHAREVSLRGNNLLAVAIVETSFESDRVVGADPVVVVLVREDRHWKVLCVCRGITTLTDAVPAICKSILQSEPLKYAPPEPRLLGRRDGQILDRDFPFLTWTVPVEGGPVLAQIFEHHFGDSAAPEESWPQARLEAFPGEPRGGKANPFTGVIGSRMSWTVWTIGQGGQIALAPAVHFEVR
jgi:hypothetical protein